MRKSEGARKRQRGPDNNDERSRPELRQMAKGLLKNYGNMIFDFKLYI